MLRPHLTLRFGALALAASGFALSITGCGSSTPTEAELGNSFKLAGMSSSQASCAAAAIFDTLDGDQVAEIIERGPSGVPYDDPKSTDDDMDRVRAALAKCRAAAESETTGTNTTTTTSTTPVSSTTTGPQPSGSG